MPLQIAPGTAPEPSDHLDHLDQFAALAMGGAPNIPGGVMHPTEIPAAAHRQRDDLTSELTDSLDNLAKHFDALTKAGFKGADPGEITKLLKGLHADVRSGRSTGDNARKATDEVESLFHKLSNEFHFMSDEQKVLTDKLMKHLAASEKLTEGLVKRSSRPGRVAGALAHHAGLGDYFDAAFKPRKARAEDDYQSTFARLARVAAGNRGLGNIYDAAFKAPSRGRVARAVSDRPDHVPESRPAKPASAIPLTPSTPATPAGDNILQFVRPVERNSSISASTPAIPVISIGKDEARIAASMDWLNKNVIRLNGSLDRDHKQRAMDYERRRQEQFDHDQALFGKKDVPASHGPGAALQAAATAHAKEGSHGGGGWLTDLVHAVTEGGFGAEAGAAGLGGLLLDGKKILGRGTAVVKGAGKGVAKGLGGLTRFVKGRHGRLGLMAGLLAGTAYGAYSLFGSHAADAAETPQGAPRPEEDATERHARRKGDAPEDDRPEESELGFDAAETARGAAFHGVEKTVDAVEEHLQVRRDAAEHARQRVALEHTEHAPGREAADFTAKERALMGESPAAHAAKAVPTSPARSAAQAVQLGAEGAEVEAPIAGAVHATPGAGFDKQIEKAAADVVKDRTGARVVSSAAKALGKGLSRVLGPLGVILEGYSCWEQLCNLYGMHRNKEISDSEFNAEFYAILARTLAGPAGAAIGAKLGALGGGAAGAAFAGVGAGPGALIGGLAGGIAGYFEGPQLADKLVHKLLDEAKPGIDAEIDAKTAGKTTPSTTEAKPADGAKPGEDGQPRNAMGGPAGAHDGAADALSQVEGTGPAAYNGQGVDPGPHPSSTGDGDAAWDGATSKSSMGVGHQGEVRHASDAFKGSGRRRAGRGVEAADQPEGGGGTASSRTGRVTDSSPMPKGDGKTDPGSIKGVLFKGESGGNPGIANYRGPDGRYHVKHFDSDTMTIGDLMKAQSQRQIFAAGKYQMIPNTLKDGVKALGLKSTDKFDSATQDRLYTDYLAGSKRPSISAYITGKKGSSLDKANVAMAEEWASVGDPSRGGRGHYDGDGANHASISVQKAQAALQKGKATYDRLVGEGKSPEFARRAALLGIEHPEGDGTDMPRAPKAVPDGTETTPGPAQASGVLAPRSAVTPSQPAPGGGVSPDDRTLKPVTPRNGETTEQLAARVQHANPKARSAECVGLARQIAGIHEGVRDWRAGGKVSDGSMPVGTPIATFMDRHGNQSDRYDGGQGVGVHAKEVIAASHGRLRAGTTHAAVLAGYERDKNGRVTGIKVAQQWVGRGAHIATIKVGDKRGGEADADNYRSVNGRDGQPLGDMNPLNPQAKNYAGDGGAAVQPAAPGPLPAPKTTDRGTAAAAAQGAPAGLPKPAGMGSPQVPAAKAIDPSDRVSTGWDPGMRSSYDAAATPQVPAGQADPGMRGAYDPKPSQPGPDGKADPGMRSAYDAPPPATAVEQPDDVPVQAAKTSAAISSAADLSGGDSSGGASAPSGGGGDQPSGGSSGGGFCRCTGGGAGGGGGARADGFGDGPMSPLLAMMNSTIFNRG